MITAEYTIPGLHVREHEVAVPLDWAAPDAETLDTCSRGRSSPRTGGTRTCR